MMSSCGLKRPLKFLNIDHKTSGIGSIIVQFRTIVTKRKSGFHPYQMTSIFSKLQGVLILKTK